MEVSLRAIDVGFDARVLGMPICLPAGVARVLTDDGAIEGSRAEIVAELQRRGWLVADSSAPQRDAARHG